MPAANDKHEALFQDLAEVLKRHGSTLTSPEILAVLSNMVGKVMAMQDQRRMTSAQAISIVSTNIEIGNKQIIDELLNKTGGNA